MFIDLLFLLLLVGFLALGFFQGVIRLSILLFSYYLSVVLASFLFYPLGVFFLNKFGTNPNVGMYIAFALIMLLSLALLSAYGLYSVRDFHLPGHLMYVDRFTGVFVSLILSALFLGMFAVLFWNLLIVKGAETLDLPIMRFLGASVRRSFLLRYFATYILPTAYNFADPILPDGASIIFAVGG
jgi:uncharacterized membrane protein required for colicin V production